MSMNKVNENAQSVSQEMLLQIYTDTVREFLRWEIRKEPRVFITKKYKKTLTLFSSDESLSETSTFHLEITSPDGSHQTCIVHPDDALWVIANTLRKEVIEQVRRRQSPKYKVTDKEIRAIINATKEGKVTWLTKGHYPDEIYDGEYEETELVLLDVEDKDDNTNRIVFRVNKGMDDDTCHCSFYRDHKRPRESDARYALLKELRLAIREVMPAPLLSVEKMKEMIYATEHGTLKWKENEESESKEFITVINNIKFAIHCYVNEFDPLGWISIQAGAIDAINTLGGRPEEFHFYKQDSELKALGDYFWRAIVKSSEKKEENVTTLRAGLIEKLLSDTLSGDIKWENDGGKLFTTHCEGAYIIFNRLTVPELSLDEINIRVTYVNGESDVIMTSERSRYWKTLIKLTREITKQTGKIPE